MRWCLVVLVLFWPLGAWAEAPMVEDRLGNQATVEVVTHEGLRFAAVTVHNPSKKGAATHLLRRSELSRLFLACKIALKSDRPVEENEQVTVDRLKGEKARLEVVLVHREEQTTGLLLVIEEGREREYLLDQESYGRLQGLLRQARSELSDDQ